MAEVRLENVSRAYAGDTIAVDSVNLEVHDEEFLVLVGPSGCGKTTTLRMIAGLEEITSGHIFIGERLVNDVAPRDRDIAMVFQNYALYPHMNVRKNMAFGLELRYGGGMLTRALRRLVRSRMAAELAEKRRGIEARVTETAQTLGIESLLGRMPRQLSGGERQRVALGRAIVRQPAAFLFDEPLSNLDAKLRVEMRRELKRLHQRLKTTMIYVTHDQVEALTLGQRIAVMNRGKLEQVGEPMEVYLKPVNRVVAGFIGTPAMNFVDGEIINVAGRLGFRGRAGQTLVASDGAERLLDQVGKRVTLGIRPEDVRIVDQGAFAARIVVVEPLGDACLVHLQLVEDDGQGAEDVICKTDSNQPLHSRGQLRVDLVENRIHLFDLETGENLIH